MREKYSIDRGKLLKFEGDSREFANYLEQLIQTVKQCFFNENKNWKKNIGI